MYSRRRACTSYAYSRRRRSQSSARPHRATTRPMRRSCARRQSMASPKWCVSRSQSSDALGRPIHAGHLACSPRIAGSRPCSAAPRAPGRVLSRKVRRRFPQPALPRRGLVRGDARRRHHRLRRRDLSRGPRTRGIHVLPQRRDHAVSRCHPKLRTAPDPPPAVFCTDRRSLPRFFVFATCCHVSGR